MSFVSMNRKTLTQTLSMIVSAILVSSVLVLPSLQAFQAFALDLTCQTDKSSYYVREPVTIQGTFTEDGQPVSEGLIAMEIDEPGGGQFAYRTVAIGTPGEPFFTINATPTDQNQNPLSIIRVNTSLVGLSVTVQSTLLNDVHVTLACTVYDNALIPIVTTEWEATIYAMSNASFWTLLGSGIPEWTKPGRAIICSNVLTAPLRSGGYPYMPEKFDYFDIVMNEQLPPPGPQLPPTHQTQTGQYTIYLRTSPDYFSPPGNYTIHVSGKTSTPLVTSATTTFNVSDYPTPPRASFTYYPPAAYENMTLTFDANSSSAEGYHDSITRSVWKINDPNNPETIVNPPARPRHKFLYTGNYTVELNITDSQNLWTMTTKTVTVSPESGPTANFTWTPLLPYPKSGVAFNATSTIMGWSAQTGQFSPIVNYEWNWGDGTPNSASSNPVTYHSFQVSDNYTVTLNVTDSRGRWNTTSKIVRVLNYTSFPWDVTGDGYVGINDIFEVALHFGQTVPPCDPKYDITGDYYVGVNDIFQVALHFGEEWP